MTCEWNPKENRAAYDFDEKHKPAKWCIGYKGEWHLCDDCAKLPQFKKYKVRILLRTRAHEA